MNKINPLFLLFTSCIVMMIGIYSLDNANKSVLKSQENLEKFSTTAQKFSSLDGVFRNTNEITKRLEKIIKKSKIKNANISNANKTIVLEVKKINKPNLNSFINKLLNEKFNIKKLDISSSSLRIEIGVL